MSICPSKPLGKGCLKTQIPFNTEPDECRSPNGALYHQAARLLWVRQNTGHQDLSAPANHPLSMTTQALKHALRYL